MTAQLGDDAALAATTSINVVSDLRAMDLALGGQGAPIVPIGEKLLLPGYDYFLNLGGIANISCHAPEGGSHTPAAGGAAEGSFVAFDVCPANRVLNTIAATVGKPYDEGGTLAASGKTNMDLLHSLNSLSYYEKKYPKSLANDFGTDVLYPMILRAGLTAPDALRTYTENICVQVRH